MSYCPIANGPCVPNCHFRTPAVGCELIRAVQAIPEIAAELRQIGGAIAERDLQLRADAQRESA